MLDFAICAVANLLRIYVIERFVGVFLGKSQAGRKKVFGVCACFYIANILLYWTFHTVWINIACSLIGIGAVVRLHTKSFRTNLFVTCSTYIINMGCDTLATLPFVHYVDGQSFAQVYSALSIFLFLICELVVEKILTSRKEEEITQRFCLFFVPLCSVGIIYFLFYFGNCSGVGIGIVSIGLLAINFFMFYLYDLLLGSVSQKYETEMLRQKVQVYANQLDVILQGEEKAKALRHDMKHHMNEIRLLADRYGAAEIRRYVDRMEDFIHNPREVVSSGNVEIDSVLNYMLQRAREELDTVTVKVVLPEEIQHSFDINILLGNLLENAIEAAKQTERKYLGVQITLNREVLKIEVENSFRPENLVWEEQGGRNRSLLTTKRVKEQHGIGLKNVRKIVESYNGVMEEETKGDVFCVKLILYMTEMGK
ncbi:MAG: GHKL domain-containing protein [Acetatifactor sp.]|nr:GHKL domain-containing protein [Acetatifactor sp.]